MDKPESPNERRVWVAQCLCPDRHCIVAAANEANSEAEAQEITVQLRRQVTELLRSGAINPWCGICGAKRATWKYELGRTMFATIHEASPHLARLERENATARELFGDLHKGRPH
jgi:hypothetical protein